MLIETNNLKIKALADQLGHEVDYDETYFCTVITIYDDEVDLAEKIFENPKTKMLITLAKGFL